MKPTPFARRMMGYIAKAAAAPIVAVVTIAFFGADLGASASSADDASDVIGTYNGFFKHSDPATPPSPCVLDIASVNNRHFTATLWITFGSDAPVAYSGEGTVSASGNASIIAKAGLDMIDVKVDATTFLGGAATLNGTGKRHQPNAPDIDGTFILLRPFDFDPQNPPPSLDGLVYRGRRIGDDGSSGPTTVVLNQSELSNTLIGQGAFGLSAPPSTSASALAAGDPPLTWAILGTVSNIGDVVWIAQTAEHRLETILHFADSSNPASGLFGTYSLHSLVKQTGSISVCSCPFELTLVGIHASCVDVGCPVPPK